ncbi:MAG TPA: hypothetical protein PLW65_19755, partial [Pseudomonadota bacterium]|nr:hypothetical protein [Pseudomonadota bacterium]
MEPPSALAVTAPRSLEVAPARGVLYLAAESALDKPRAVLVLPASPSSRPDLEGVRQLCGLVHPNLLQVLEGGRTEDELFAASE